MYAHTIKNLSQKCYLKIASLNVPVILNSGMMLSVIIRDFTNNEAAMVKVVLYEMKE